MQRHNSDADFLSFVVENEDNYDATPSVEMPGTDYFKQLSIQFYSLPTQQNHKVEKKQPKSNIDDNFYQINGGKEQVPNRPSLQYQRNGLREIIRLQQSKQPSNKDTATTASSFLYNQTSDVSFSKNQMSPGRVLKQSGGEIKSFIKIPRSIPKGSPEPVLNNNLSPLDFYSIYDLEQEVINEKKFKNQFIPAKKMLDRDNSTKTEKSMYLKNQIEAIQKKLNQNINKLNESKEELTGNQQFRVSKTIKLRPKVVMNPQNNSQDQLLYIQFGNIKQTSNTIIQEQLTNQLILEKQKSKYSFKPQIDLRSHRLQ